MPATGVAERDPGAAPPPRPDTLTLLAFAATAILAGGNAVAVKIGYAELAPFWGAAVRFLAAALILLVAAAVLRRTLLPRGRALAGVIAYGALNFGLGYIFIYWALVEVTAGAVMVVLAIVPLLTIALAVAQGVERFSTRGLAGAVMAAAGIVVVFGDNVGVASALALVALILGALSFAQVPVVVKTFPPVDPVVENGLGMAVGGLMHLVLSLAIGEPRAIPGDPFVQISLVYLVLLGSIGLFLLYLFVLARWTASATSYVLLLAPLATVVLEWAIMGEAPSPMLLAGGALVVAGVYVGAIAGPHTPVPPRRPGSPENR